MIFVARAKVYGPAAPRFEYVVSAAGGEPAYSHLLRTLEHAWTDRTGYSFFLSIAYFERKRRWRRYFHHIYGCPPG